MTVAFAAEDRNAILAKAKEEKTLLLYSTSDFNDTTALVNAFQKKYPFVEPKPLRVPSSQMPVRVVQENKAGVNVVDVIQAENFHIKRFLGPASSSPIILQSGGPFPVGLRTREEFGPVVIDWEGTRLKC